MTTLRVMMRPMDNSAFFIPDILPVEAHTVAYIESVDSRGDVDVMRDQQRLSRRKLNDKSLVSRTVQIVGQNANHLALAFDLYVACPTRKRAADGIVDERRRTLFSDRTGSGARDENECKEGNGRRDQNGVRTSPKKDVLNESRTQFLHDKASHRRGRESSTSNRTFSFLANSSEKNCAIVRPRLQKRSGPTCDAITKSALDHQPSLERMTIMTTNTSATALEDAPHITETTRATRISDALRRRAQSVISDRSIDAESRALIRYGLEINDPILAELVRRADAGESILEALPDGEISETSAEDSSEERVEALAEIICRAGDEPESKSAALFVLMGAIEHSNDPKLLANSAKHFAFSRCGEFNLYGMVDAQIAVIEGELLADK